MRNCRVLLAFALLLSGCATGGSERFDMVIFNDTPQPHSIRVDVDGHTSFQGSVVAIQREPAIVGNYETDLSAGRHHIDVTCDNATRSLDFEVRRGKQTNVQIHVKESGVTIDVAYGELAYM